MVDRKKSEATLERQAAADAKKHDRLLRQVRKMNESSSSSSSSRRHGDPPLDMSEMYRHMSAQRDALVSRRAHDRAENRRAAHRDRRHHAIRNYRPTWHTECWKPCREAEGWDARAADTDVSGCTYSAVNDPLAIRMRSGLHKGEPMSLLAVMEHRPTVIQPEWHPADRTSSFGRAHTAMNSRSYYRGLRRHLAHEAGKVRADYAALPERVAAERNLKGDVGRDLDEWETEERLVVREGEQLGNARIGTTQHGRPHTAPQPREPLTPTQYGISYGPYPKREVSFDLRQSKRHGRPHARPRTSGGGVPPVLAGAPSASVRSALGDMRSITTGVSSPRLHDDEA